MKIKAGDKLRVNCQRKGVYDAVAATDFDTETDEWYPVNLDQETPLKGINGRDKWFQGDDVPCRNGHATITRR
jgi:hypothetical protein